MPERIIGPNEVSINGEKYRLAAGTEVRTSIASVYPPKFITGDITKDSQDGVSVITWTDQRGGMGIERTSGEPEHQRRYWSSEMITHQKDRLTIPVKNTATAAPPNTIDVIGEHNSIIYIAQDSLDVHSYNNAGDSWTDTTHNLASRAYDTITFRHGGSEVIVFACDTNWTTYDGSTWRNHTDDMRYVAFWDDKLYGIDSTGLLKYTSDASVASPTITNDAQLPVPDGWVSDLLTGPDPFGNDILYALTRDGLWVHDAVNTKWIRTSLRFPEYTAPGIGHQLAVTWRGKIYVAVDMNVYEYDPIAATIRVIGPDIDDGVRDDAAVRMRAPLGTLLSSHVALIAISHDDVSDNSGPRIFSWSGIGWQEDGKAGTIAGASNAPSALVSNAYGSYRLWVAEYLDGGGTDAMLYFPLRRNVSFADESLSLHNGSFHHYYPSFDAGQPEVEKLALRAHIDTSNMTAGIGLFTARLAYAADFGTTFLSFTGNITTDGVTTYTFPEGGNGQGLSFRSLRLRASLSNAAGETTSPSINAVSLEYRKKLPVRRRFTCQLDLNKWYGASPKSQRANLETAMTASTKVEFTYRDDTGDTRNYYCDIVQIGAQERTGHDERGLTTVVLEER